MIRQIVLCICFGIIFGMMTQPGFTQNLIPNPSFEEITECPTYEELWDTYLKVKNWYKVLPVFAGGINEYVNTPDLICYCADSMIVDETSPGYHYYSPNLNGYGKQTPL